MEVKAAVPAYAGVILDVQILKCLQKSCSRVCGGDPLLLNRHYVQKALFPRMRG